MAQYAGGRTIAPPRMHEIKPSTILNLMLRSLNIPIVPPQGIIPLLFYRPASAASLEFQKL
jgi:hypothetical protein